MQTVKENPTTSVSRPKPRSVRRIVRAEARAERASIRCSPKRAADAGCQFSAGVRPEGRPPDGRQSVQRTAPHTTPADKRRPRHMVEFKNPKAFALPSPVPFRRRSDETAADHNGIRSEHAQSWTERCTRSDVQRVTRSYRARGLDSGGATRSEGTTTPPMGSVPPDEMSRGDR
jgi:hypothetical protein